VAIWSDRRDCRLTGFSRRRQSCWWKSWPHTASGWYAWWNIGASRRRPKAAKTTTDETESSPHGLVWGRSLFLLSATAPLAGRLANVVPDEQPSVTPFACRRGTVLDQESTSCQGKLDACMEAVGGAGEETAGIGVHRAVGPAHSREGGAALPLLRTVRPIGEGQAPSGRPDRAGAAQQAPVAGEHLVRPSAAGRRGPTPALPAVRQEHGLSRQALRQPCGQCLGSGFKWNFPELFCGGLRSPVVDGVGLAGLASAASSGPAARREWADRPARRRCATPTAGSAR
jgi:hypothetical protein